ncbi:hypothetical protein K491DRAFT_677691 [Lophiostoma macrostomum CBS 122681]|uniref:Uncharacterized protein n=1 Tax=Lophiostoma macrostomum CBS 122681 TaxID=1314788 RepID=A0A6A6TAC2_9PLEO|nr:hypothetical protein K491DRAFT_677691 [Lophiostoma macrostomum CBS 122681]
MPAYRSTGQAQTGQHAQRRRPASPRRPPPVLLLEGGASTGGLAGGGWRNMGASKPPDGSRPACTPTPGPQGARAAGIGAVHLRPEDVNACEDGTRGHTWRTWVKLYSHASSGPALFFCTARAPLGTYQRAPHVNKQPARLLQHRQCITASPLCPCSPVGWWLAGSTSSSSSSVCMRAPGLSSSTTHPLGLCCVCSPACSLGARTPPCTRARASCRSSGALVADAETGAPQSGFPQLSFLCSHALARVLSAKGPVARCDSYAISRGSRDGSPVIRAPSCAARLAAV